MVVCAKFSALGVRESDLSHAVMRAAAAAAAAAAISAMLTPEDKMLHHQKQTDGSADLGPDDHGPAARRGQRYPEDVHTPLLLQPGRGRQSHSGAA